MRRVFGALVVGCGIEVWWCSILPALGGGLEETEGWMVDGQLL